MSVKLDWQIGDDEEERPERKERRWGITYAITLLAVAAGVILFFGVRDVSNDEAERADARLRSAVQAAVDVERRAFLAGDGDLFFANQLREPGWISAQLRPENQALYRQPLTVTRADEDGDDVWASVSWTEDGVNRQRLLFFRWRGNQLVHFPSAQDFWGLTFRQDAPWGEIRLREADHPWGEAIVSYVAELIANTCEGAGGSNCLPDRLPFTLTIASDYAVTAVADQLRIPSPRLLALDENGEPAELFWNRLRQEVIAYLTPSRIRFALPPELVGQTVFSDYQRLARQFSINRPDIDVEIVSLDQLSADPLAWPSEIDGAAIMPDESMLAAGLVHDLSDYINSDPDFDQADFYEQIWQGARWQDGIWIMPQSGRMRLIFYDKVSYRQAGLSEPSLRWTWQEMANDIAALEQLDPGERSIAPDTAFLDLSRDALFAYAYSHDTNCAEVASGYCPRHLEVESVLGAYQWFRRMTSRPDRMPDVTGLSDEEREFTSFNIRGAIWTDDPILYEHHLLLRPTGVTTFPGSDRFDGITPLWVDGSFISQHSLRPRAVWEWLKFLSYRHLSRGRRQVPARPSVAEISSYWATLPRPLGEALRTAFPFAQPVRISDRAYFDWPQLAQVVSGEITADEAAQRPAHPRWFQAPQ